MKKKIIMKWSSILLLSFAVISAIYYFAVAKLPQEIMTQAEILAPFHSGHLTGK
jgi:hypothetical protein